jgi:hypothetical protein
MLPSLNCACLQVWKKVLPLGLVFFVASFNLTILQARGRVGIDHILF